jgi:2-hydroxychromene-2-carboxylate isomerase
MAVIEVYADIWCPFAHVGLRTVVRRRRQLGRGDVGIRVRAWPLELVNGAPLDVDATAEHVHELREQVAPSMFANFRRHRFPRTTLPALALSNAAYRVDDATGEAVSLALRDALFEEGRDVSRPDELTAIALAHGINDRRPGDEVDVLADWRCGESRGVRGSPHFFCGAIESFCPSLVISRDSAGVVHLRKDAEALDAFLTECFSSD